MKYNPRKKSLSIETGDAVSAANALISAIHYTRKESGFPLEGYVQDGKNDTVEYCILEAAKYLGIDLGATRPGELDVREFS